MLSGFALPSLRERLLHHLEPPRTWHYRAQQVRLWPIVLPALLLFFSVIAFLVHTNYDSATCTEQLHYDRWQGAVSQAQGCKAVDSITTDWTRWLLQDQLETPPLLPMYGIPTVDVSFASSTDGYDVYSPLGGECGLNETQVESLTEVDVHVQAVNYSTQPGMQRYHVFLFMAATFHTGTQLYVNIASLVPFTFSPYLRDGAARYSYQREHEANTSAIQVRSTTWVNGTAQVTAIVQLLYVELLPTVLQIYMVKACSDYASKQHLQSCVVCTKTSPATITWIIVLGIVQAITSIATISAWLIRHCNKDKVIKEEPCGAVDSSDDQQPPALPMQELVESRSRNDLRQQLLS